MQENPYQVLGVGIPTLRGRKNEWNRLLRHLEKTTPDHVSVVGPRYVGKTVLLNAVAAYFANGRSPFDACAYWDMRRGAPDTDAAFYLQFARQLTGPVTRVHRDAGAELAEKDGGTFDVLRLVFETLAEEHKKILVILDGLDSVLLAPDLTRNLWDSLRSLAELSSLRFVTGSRHRLGELCTPDSKTSPFWNLFAPTLLNLGALKDDDWNDILAPFKERGVGFQPGAQTEIANWSGSVPILVSFLCGHLWEKIQNSEVVNPQDINRLATDSFDRTQDLLGALWSDCSEYERGDIAELAQGRELRVNDLQPQRLRTLTQRGFIKEKGGALVCSCRFMELYAKEHGASSTDLRRLFGTPEIFYTNIKRLLELRFRQLHDVDQEMYDFLDVAIQSLEKTHVVVNQIRALAGQALDLVLSVELPDGTIPAEWTMKWEHMGEMNPPKGKTPPKFNRGAQCKLLRLMVDTRSGIRTRISRPTYLLIDHLQSVGDFGQHREGELVPGGFCVAVCLAAIELCEQLAKELAA